ncbi:protein kinase domain-containing protein [Pendulispora albinea]|uniref:Serine/threonine protein kinase n=1 Tax=Pendulispora albinea TaxID=2741071 RepID=A0ABZ2M9H1_9BACT
MKGPWTYVSGLLDLPRMNDPAERRASWRQAMATLARVSAENGPSPLDGLHPDALVRVVKVALGDDLLDDLDWLAPSASGAALYALAAALPPGPEQREVGRRVLARLNTANAETFVAMATRMALGSGKGLGTSAVRARVGLVLELPLALGVRDGPLAHGLCSSRELMREWIVIPSTGSLHARRMAARLLERAAREAATRAQQGDDHALRVFHASGLQEAWRRLLGDRESLVWRSIAVARGLLSPFFPELKKEVMVALTPEYTPTEWRRGATSLAAMVAVQPEPALRSAGKVIASGVLERDPGVAAAFAWGLARAAEAEPEAARTLLDRLVAEAGFDSAEAVAELLGEYGKVSFVERAAAKAISALARISSPDYLSRDDSAEALAREIARDLKRETRADPSLREQLAYALELFVSQGARQAYAAAREVLAGASAALDTLDALAQDEDEAAKGRGGTTARRTSLAVVRDLDITLLERHTLSDLLKLGGSDAARHEVQLDTVRERIASWILARETGPGAHETLRLRRLRALIHLVDSDVGSQDDPVRAANLRKRWCRIAASLIERFESGPPPELVRTLSAALARALDALVRAEAIEAVDALLVGVAVGDDLAQIALDDAVSGHDAHLRTLAEASMDPDLKHMFERYERFVAACEPMELHAQLGALEELARELFLHPSKRGEVFRKALVGLHAALVAIEEAPTLSALIDVGGEQGPIGALETHLATIQQLTRFARGRVELDRRASFSVLETATERHSKLSLVDESTPEILEEGLRVLVARVVSGAEQKLTREAVAGCEAELRKGVPPSIFRVVSAVLVSLHAAPVDSEVVDTPHIRGSTGRGPQSARLRSSPDPLPAWVPPRRTIGGFFIVKALGSGGSGSVFVVNRVEDRHDPNAERFALKVPDYSATAARTLSEQAFLELFRAEASALIALPTHKNLARFVTFDLAARPKPILVMELVEGVSFANVIDSRALDMQRCFAVLDDVLRGLEAMHRVGVGHLDLTPSNVVLRQGQDGVLVDFGLAGRHIRPGCATGPYGAPEVWGAGGENQPPTPQAADVYAFGCLAFEALTGVPLFQAPSEMALISAHISHDGLPPRLRALATRVGLAPLGEAIFWTLRRDPAQRPPVAQVRSNFAQVASRLSGLKWPLSI